MAHHHACHECDLLVDVAQLQEGEEALCPRCGCSVLHKKTDAIRRTKVVAISGLLFFLPAVLLPLMAIHAIGRSNSASIMQGVEILYSAELYIVSILVLGCCIVAPLVKLLLSLALVHFFDKPEMQQPWYRASLLFYQRVDAWEMLEVFMIGILVTVVKLKDMAELTFGAGLLCFVGLLLCLVSLRATFDKEQIWEKIHEH